MNENIINQNQDRFMSWVAENYKNVTASEYPRLFKEIEEFCLKTRVIKQPLFESYDFDTAYKAKKVIESNKIFRFKHKKSIAKYMLAISHYILFIKELEKGKTVLDKKQEEKHVLKTQVEPAESIDYKIRNQYPTFYEDIYNTLKELSEKYEDSVSVISIANHVNCIVKLNVIKEILDQVSWAKADGKKYIFCGEESVKIHSAKSTITAKESTEYHGGIDIQRDKIAKAITIAEAIQIVMEKANKPLSSEEVYGLIIAENLYSFGAQNPVNVVNIKINAACIGSGYKHRARQDLYGFTVENGEKKYYLLSRKDEMSKVNSLDIEPSISQKSPKVTCNRADDKEIVADVSIKIVEDKAIDSFNAVVDEKKSNSSQQIKLKNYNYNSSTTLRFTKPELVMYFGVIDSNVASWRDVLKSILNSLCDDYLYQIVELAKDSQCSLLSFNASDLRRPILVSNGIYAEGNKSATEIARAIRKLLDICKVDYENVVIRYLEYDEEPSSKEIVATDEIGESDNSPATCELLEIDRRLYEVIENRYISGFLPGAINFKKIKRFYEEIYSQSLDLDGIAIEHSLNKTCLKVNGKFYAPSSLMEYELKIRVNAYIEKAIQSKGYVFYDNILIHFGYELTERIPDVVLLKKYLEKEYPQYSALDGYLARDARIVIDATKEVEQVLFESVFPMSVEKIKSLLPHLTEEAIQKVIWCDDKIIVTNNNDRFLIDSMGLTDEDIILIENLINEALNTHNCMFGNELLTSIQTKLPNLYESIRDFGDRGIRGAIACKLKDKFRFNANIICKIGANIDNAEVFRTFAKSERYFTLSALINLKEQIGVGNVYFESVNEVASRINDNDYVPNEDLQFDSRAIDGVLNQIVNGNMCSLKEASNFAIYPSTSYPWTEYLLESYVAKFSNEFKLCHGGYAEGKCCGAVVKKSVSLNSIDDVVVEYLVLNKEIHTTKEALERLVEDGFIARRRYKNIEDLLIVAKARRKG